MGDTMTTQTDLRKLFLTKVAEVNFRTNPDYHFRKMLYRLHEEFDKVWVRYNNGDATMKEWENSLNKWIKMEQI
jgi:hypothetical protein|tara:strand:- start:419 stop:640 length:222 start_codon:yes stop_codon:yes gene_type:complete